MREIKFRGIDCSGQWVYGDLIHKRHDKESVLIQDYKGLGSDVDITTVGQYTGLKDKNGKEIYEGDVVDVWSQGSHITNGIIKWGKGTCRFFIGNVQNSICWQLSGDENGMETLVIIGNIHDNPELIKEEEQ